jgi:hypothetical protein
MAASCHLGKDAANPHQRPTKSLRGPWSLLNNRARQRIRIVECPDERLRRVPVGWLPCGRRALIPEGFVAPQAKVSAFSFIAPRLVEEFLAALPARVLQKSFSPVHRRAGSGPRADAVRIPV